MASALRLTAKHLLVLTGNPFGRLHEQCVTTSAPLIDFPRCGGLELSTSICANITHGGHFRDSAPTVLDWRLPGEDPGHIGESRGEAEVPAVGPGQQIAEERAALRRVAAL